MLHLYWFNLCKDWKCNLVVLRVMSQVSFCLGAETVLTFRASHQQSKHESELIFSSQEVKHFNDNVWVCNHRWRCHRLVLLYLHVSHFMNNQLFSQLMRTTWTTTEEKQTATSDQRALHILIWFFISQWDVQETLQEPVFYQVLIPSYRFTISHSRQNSVFNTVHQHSLCHRLMNHLIVSRDTRISSAFDSQKGICYRWSTRLCFSQYLFWFGAGTLVNKHAAPWTDVAHFVEEEFLITGNTRSFSEASYESRKRSSRVTSEQVCETLMSFTLSWDQCYNTADLIVLFAVLTV